MKYLNNEIEFRLFPWMTLDHATHLLRRVMTAKRYLEWGSGGSTIAAAQLFTGERFWSIEHDPDWGRRVWEIIRMLVKAGVRISAHATETPQVLLARDTYLSRCSFWPWDLILIDGYEPWRSDCIRAGWPQLEPGGSMLIHDAERKGVYAAISEVMAASAEIPYDVTEGKVRLLELRKPKA